MKKFLGFLMVVSLVSSPVSAQPAGKQTSSSKWCQALAAPIGCAGVAYGCMVGVPIKTAREIYKESRRMCATIYDDFDNSGHIVDMILACAMGVPYGIASGTILGSIYGVERGWKYGWEMPFSKVSVGLADPPSEYAKEAQSRIVDSQGPFGP